MKIGVDLFVDWTLSIENEKRYNILDTITDNCPII